MRHFSELSPSAERVVDAAQSLIQLHGYNGFSYDDIAGVIGIRKPSIHHHFPTKAELVHTVVERYADRFCRALDAIDAQYSQALSRLYAYGELFAQTYAQDRRLCVCGILGAQAQTLSPDVANAVQVFFQANIDWLAATITAGVEEGSLVLRTPASAQAYGLLSVLEGAMVVGRGVNSDGSPAQAGRDFLANLLA